jgi:hypothetical protein
VSNPQEKRELQNNHRHAKNPGALDNAGVIFVNYNKSQLALSGGFGRIERGERHFKL